MRNAYDILVAEPKGKSSSERSRRGWEDNIIMYVKVMRWERVDWIKLAQERE